MSPIIGLPSFLSSSSCPSHLQNSQNTDQSPSLQCTLVAHQDLRRREVVVEELKGAAVGMAGPPAAVVWAWKGEHCVMGGKQVEEDWRVGPEMWAGTGPEQAGTGTNVEVTSSYGHT